jgi:putative SOS response-associated peptidase YedK
MRDIHHRMPVILKPEAYEFWLNPENQDVAALKNILGKALLTDLVSYPVSKQVNSTRNNDASCIDPVH